MSGVEVSVIIPTHDRCDKIGEAVESVLAQTLDAAFELIVVDDGSTDDTGTVLAKYPDIISLRQENAGPSAARNRGVDLASGRLICFLDSDDLMSPGRLQAQVDYLAAHPDVSGVFGRQVLEGTDGEEPPELPSDPVYGDPGGINLITVMLPKELFTSVGGFDESLTRGEDRELLIRLRERGARFEVVDRVVLVRRLGSDSLTLGKRSGPSLAGMVHDHIRRRREATPAADDG